MPDPNKFEALREARFRVREVCFRCQNFEQGRGKWGKCSRIRYQHGKHTDSRRWASVPPDGYCIEFTASLEAVEALGAHAEFFGAIGSGEACDYCGSPAPNHNFGCPTKG